MISEQPSNADEAAELYKKPMQKENDILSSDKNLWEKVFNAANKNSSMIGDGSNYGDFLLATVEGAKNEFSADKSKRSRPALSRLKRSRTSSRRSRKISLPWLRKYAECKYVQQGREF